MDVRDETVWCHVPAPAFDYNAPCTLRPVNCDSESVRFMASV